MEFESIKVFRLWRREREVLVVELSLNLKECYIYGGKKLEVRVGQ